MPDEMKRKMQNEKMQKLVSLGKKKGYVTYEEVNDYLPPEMVSPDQLDDVIIGHNHRYRLRLKSSTGKYQAAVVVRVITVRDRGCTVVCRVRHRKAALDRLVQTYRKREVRRRYTVCVLCQRYISYG